MEVTATTFILSWRFVAAGHTHPGLSIHHVTHSNVCVEQCSLNIIGFKNRLFFFKVLSLENFLQIFTGVPSSAVRASHANSSSSIDKKNGTKMICKLLALTKEVIFKPICLCVFVYLFVCSSSLCTIEKEVELRRT